MDTHKRIADGDDQLIDTVECVYMSERKADACWLAAGQIQEDMQHVTLKGLTDMARTLITLEDVEVVRKDVEPNMVWVKLHTGKQYRLTPYEHVLLITRGEVSL